jgi:aryl-alcohol dehydrogenase-like predicted oxidoreductase
MKYRKLGNTGLEVSEIGYGTWGLGGKSYGDVDDNESKRALRLAYEKGVNFYDTADLYGNGHSEELLAEVFKEVRDKVIIATKGGTLPHTGFYMPQDFSPQYLRKALEASLRRLQTDYVDLYQLHSPRIEDIGNNKGLTETLEAFKSEGKIKAYGVSVRSPQDGLRAIQEFGFKVIQVNFNMIDQRALEIGLFAAAEKLNIGVIVRTPLVFGYLTGSLNGEETFQGVDHRANWPKEQLRRWANAPKLFASLVDGKERSYAQVALQFCLSHNAVSTVIPGMMNMREVEEDVQAVNLPELLPGEMAQIKKIYDSHNLYDKSAKSQGRS